MHAPVSRLSPNAHLRCRQGQRAPPGCSSGGDMQPGALAQPLPRRLQEKQAAEREAAMEAAEKRMELETLLASNLHRRRDELQQALAEADVETARWIAFLMFLY